jgi:adenylate cyclase, class 2
MSNLQEVEVKLYVPDLEAVKRRLESVGGELKAPRVYERNVRYENADNTLSRDGIVLRMRQDTRARLTYKADGKVAKGGASSRYEAEVEVNDFDTMDTILGKLGFHPYMIYEKFRTTYELDGVEVVLDELPYGNFVEIEGDEDSIQPAREKLALKDAKSYPEGYAALFDRVKRYMGLKFDDLTFANFDGVTVLERAFGRGE